MSQATDELLARLERNSLGYYPRPINPDGPEAAALIRELSGALDFYADPISYALTQVREPSTAVHGDGGRRARASLNRETKP